MQKLEPIICPHLNADNEAITHGFFTRQGGVSTGLYESLNIGPSSDDKPDNVRANRKAIVDNLAIRADDLISPWQHHSANAQIVTRHWGDKRPKADAVVTSIANLPLAIVTADCGPVLFCDPHNAVVGACHAGWRGAIGGILEATLGKMEELGAKPQNINATLGPTISAKHYEVGPEFVDNLLRISSDNDIYFTPSIKANHAMFDLPRYITTRLKYLGLNARWSGHCTYEDETRFFSYRRMTHRGESDYGRQLSAIAIKP